ncbi:hypothetical protein HOL21_00660 [Candidatus Woesearchaeota archaeon]|jgi:replication factor A1|nr:hypothetical protein [Candidatus Woesearchaeota archaeon]MBT5396707.1 hypothetical protein [Candidatus Woesearchaeota archaeon]MBT5924323.1 hypothetical protein [Candidatus Woesearchaeota archaeon]MBT6367506.1 hypothetical protein [Candidatus Woesearchaeota archaeon]MBT7763005.1 hypothetical protein [Candidatus Woesearchaeota archaeon]
MEIKDIQAKQGNIDVVMTITEKQDERTFNKFGKEGRVCNAKAKDDSGEIVLTLWNEDVDKVSVGDKIHLKNGWCSEYNGERQLSSGKFGEIEIIEKGQQEVLTNDPGMLQPGGPAAAEEPLGEEEVEVVDDEERIVG